MLFLNKNYAKKHSKGKKDIYTVAKLFARKRMGQ
jgi:hypothetical protein